MDKDTIVRRGDYVQIIDATGNPYIVARVRTGEKFGGHNLYGLALFSMLDGHDWNQEERTCTNLEDPLANNTSFPLYKLIGQHKWHTQTFNGFKINRVTASRLLMYSISKRR